jgi:hypothetical protein
MSAKFVVSHLDQQLGPFDEATLKAKWAQGEFLPIDYVFDEAKQDWVLLAERFEWAKKPAQINPPPIKATEAPKKKTPPPAPKEAAKAAVTSPSISLQPITLSGISVPTLNIPMPVEVEPVIELTTTGITSGHIPSDITKVTAIELNPLAKQPDPTPFPAAVVAPAPTPSPAPAAAPGSLKMVNGVAEVDLSTISPGQFEIKLKNAGQEIKLDLQVRSAEPAKIEWTVKPMQPVVGTDCEVVCRALDKNGHFCSDYKGPFALKAGDREINFDMVKGTASVRFQQTKAEAIEVKLIDHSGLELKLPNPFKVDWQPGPAVKLVLDGSPELVAGSPQKVQVRAVDQYGNLANTFQGTLNLEHKAG